MDHLEFFALVSNAIKDPGLEALDALSYRFGLKVVGTAVSATFCTSLEKSPIGEFVTGRGYNFVVRVHIIRVSRVAVKVLEVLCVSCRTALEVYCGSTGVLRLRDSADASFCF